MSSTLDMLLDAHQAVSDPRRGQVPVHEPKAAILTCSDARVPPSVIFDQPAGSLYVVRVAGNTATPSAIASLDYAVSALGVELIMVLGHTNCGAVGAACRRECGGFLEPLTRQICDLIPDAEEPQVDLITEQNVQATITGLTAAHTPTGEAIRSRNLVVQGVIYDLASDRIKVLTPTQI